MNKDEKTIYEAAQCDIVEVDLADIICTSGFGASRNGFSLDPEDDLSED